MVSKILAVSAAILIFVCILLVSSVDLGSVAVELSSQKADPDQELDRLLSLAYVDHVVNDPAPNVSGITVYDKSKSSPGYTVFSSKDSGAIYLMDMDGKILHNWSISSNGVWNAWWLFDDLSVVGVYNGVEDNVVKIGWDSNIIWRLKGPYHHDVSVSPEGNVYTLRRSLRRGVWLGERKIDIMDNLIMVFDSNGKYVKNVSLYSMLWDKVDERRIKLVSKNFKTSPIDVFHTNTVAVLDRDLGYARKGNVLISVRHMDLIAIVDIGMEKVVWMWGPGEIEFPHKPTILEDGNILLFDNGNLRRYSRAVIVDPKTKEIVWNYTAPKPKSFYSNSCGSAEKLPNGNVLITESNKGRLFEVTPAGEIVWEYLNQFRNSEGERMIIARSKRYPVGEFDNALAQTTA